MRTAQTAGSLVSNPAQSIAISPPGTPYGGSIVRIFPALAIKTVHHTCIRQTQQDASIFSLRLRRLMCGTALPCRQLSYGIICARIGRGKAITSVLGNTLG